MRKIWIPILTVGIEENQSPFEVCYMTNKTIQCGSRVLDFSNKTLIMGVLNVTPDSFSDGGKYDHIDRAVQKAREMVEEGADLIDIGGESTRPGHTPISAEEELERVIPIIKAVSESVSVPISIDTYKADTARESIKAGAHIINDIWGAKADPNMGNVAAELKVPIILQHNRDNQDYQSFIEDCLRDISESISIVKNAGVKDEQIVVDPGIGFAKDFSQDIEIMQNLDKLVALGYPVLLGPSRKRMIGTVLDLPVHERVEGTGAAVCFGIMKGCQIVRVHDVKEIGRMTKMFDALMGRM